MKFKITLTHLTAFLNKITKLLIPLVVASLGIPESELHTLEELGVNDSKSLSFQYLYGYIPDDVKQNNEYFSKVSDYINVLWSEYKSKEFIVSDIYNKKIYKKNLDDMNPNKLFNYMIQLMETENNMKVLSDLITNIM